MRSEKGGGGRREITIERLQQLYTVRREEELSPYIHITYMIIARKKKNSTLHAEFVTVHKYIYDHRTQKKKKNCNFTRQRTGLSEGPTYKNYQCRMDCVARGGGGGGGCCFFFFFFLHM